MAKNYVTVHKDVNNFLHHIGTDADRSFIDTVLIQFLKYDRSGLLEDTFIRWVLETFNEDWYGNFFDPDHVKSKDDFNAYGLNVYERVEERIINSLNNLVFKVFK